MPRAIVTGLDIGTSSTRVVVAEFRDGVLFVLGAGEAPSAGVRRGSVVDIDEAASGIRKACEAAERNTGVAVRHAYVGAGGAGLAVASSKGVIAVSRADGEVSEPDVERVLAAARSALPQQPNREILHEIPLRYTVDKEGNIKNPLGMIGTRLEVYALFVSAFAPALRNLIKSVEGAGLAIDDVVASPLAASYAVVTKPQKEIGVAVLDLGGSTASLAVFEEGALLWLGVLPVGSLHITHDIAIGFQASIPVAEKMKIEEGMVAADSVSKREVIQLAGFSVGEAPLVSRKDLSDIIEARLKDVFELVDKNLKRIGRAGLLPSGVVLAGGGAGIAGIVEFAKRELRLPASLGVPHVDGAADYVTDPAWAVAVGLCARASEEEQPRLKRAHSLPRRAFQKIFHWVQPFIP